ncbi:MAG: hypothetical protein R3C28_24800 [Pirellulaceae bacterium]
MTAAAVVGGDLEDNITGPGHDLILGDYGDITKDASDLLEVATTIDPHIGGNDTIVSGEGNDSVIGGTADDLITTSEGEDIVIEDAGTLTAVAGVINESKAPNNQAAVMTTSTLVAKTILPSAVPRTTPFTAVRMAMTFCWVITA